MAFSEDRLWVPWSPQSLSWVAMHRPEQNVHGGDLEQQERKAPASWAKKNNEDPGPDLHCTTSLTCREKTEKSCEDKALHDAEPLGPFCSLEAQEVSISTLGR